MSSTATSRKKLLKSTWLCTALPSQPLQRPGAILIKDQRIVALGDPRTLQCNHPDAEVTDFGDAIILPGLINAHTHLELSRCAPGDAPTSFVDWILRMPRRVGREVNQPADDKFAAATRAGIAQSIRFGVTTLGDISQQMHVTRALLSGAALRAVSYGEVIGLGKRRHRFDELLPLALNDEHASDHLRIGISPHSPYTVEPDALRRCVRLARDTRMPLAIHLAETADEEQFLRTHSGALQEMWDQLGSWQEFPGAFAGTPVEFAGSLGLLNDPTLLAHVNYCSNDDLSLLARGNASVVYCPRTHRYFGHPPHRWREMLAAGINVAVGTDSCASSPNLNLVDDLRLLHQIAPEHPVEDLWQMATTRAARALTWGDEIGSIAPGKAADFAIFDVTTDQPLKEILESDVLPREVWIAGARVTGSPASPC